MSITVTGFSGVWTDGIRFPSCSCYCVHACSHVCSVAEVGLIGTLGTSWHYIVRLTRKLLACALTQTHAHSEPRPP